LSLQAQGYLEHTPSMLEKHLCAGAKISGGRKALVGA